MPSLSTFGIFRIVFQLSSVSFSQLSVFIQHQNCWLHNIFVLIRVFFVNYEHSLSFCKSRGGFLREIDSVFHLVRVVARDVRVEGVCADNYFEISKIEGDVANISDCSGRTVTS